MDRCRQDCDTTENCNFFYFYNACSGRDNSAVLPTLCFLFSTFMVTKKCRLFSSCTEQTSDTYGNDKYINGLTFMKTDQGDKMIIFNTFSIHNHNLLILSHKCINFFLFFTKFCCKMGCRKWFADRKWYPIII